MTKKKIWIMLSPSLVVIAIFLCALCYTFLLSFNFFSIVPGSTTGIEPYIRVLSSHSFLKSLMFSLYFSCLSTVISLFLALIISFALGDNSDGDFRSSPLFSFIYGINQPVPHMVCAFAILMIFAQSGIMSRVLYTMGIVTDPGLFPILVYDQWGVGIIISFVWKFVPFIGVQILAILRATGDRYCQVAKTLGANRFKRWRYVMLPLSLPSMVSSSILVFAYAFGSFEVPYVLGATNPKALAVLAYERYISVDLNARAEAAVISNIITIVTVVLVAVYLIILKKQDKQYFEKGDIHV